MSKSRVLTFGVIFSVLSLIGAASTSAEAFGLARKLPDLSTLMHARAILATSTCLVSAGFLTLCLVERRQAGPPGRFALAATVGLVVEGVYQLGELMYFGSLLFKPSPMQAFLYLQFGLFAAWTFLKMRYYLMARRAFAM